MIDLIQRSLGLVFVLLLFALGLPRATLGQGAITADRPGLGDGSSVLAPRTLQAEFGAAAANDDFGPNGEIGQLLLRYGVADVLELRGGLGSVAIDAPDTEYTGTSVGAKLRLLHVPTSTLSFVTSWSLPTGSGFFDSDTVAQTLNLAYDGALGQNLTITLNAGTTIPYDDDPDPVYQFIPTLSFGVADNVGAYVGYAGFYTETINTNFVEAGVTLLSTLNTQLDLNTGLQIDENRDAFFIGAGIAHRF